MSARKPTKLPPEPPPAVMELFRHRLSARELQAFGALIAVRTTAQQAENALTEWMADSASTTSRFLILMHLWAAKDQRRGLPHKEIVASLGVTRATVSGLMAGLERDGLVTSAEASDDRRNLLASLTPKGEAIIAKAFEKNRTRVRTAFAVLSPDELTTLTALLARLRGNFSVGADGPERARRRA